MEAKHAPLYTLKVSMVMIVIYLWCHRYIIQYQDHMFHNMHVSDICPSTQKDNILSLASNGHFTCTIASRLSLSQSTVSRTLRNLYFNQHHSSGDCPSKLSATCQKAVLTQITTGKAANAMEAIKHINTIISTPVSSETVRRVLRKNSFKAVVMKKKPLLSARHRQRRLAFALKHRNWTVEDWKRVI